MDNTTIFDPIPWKLVGLAVLHTTLIYWGVVLGLKLVGRRVFGEMGPQDLVLLFLIAEATNAGLTPQEGGFWASVGSVLTLLVWGGVGERIPWLRRQIEHGSVCLLEHGRLNRKKMKQYMVDEDDLKAVARKYGQPDYHAFETIALESDGSLSGVLKPEYRNADASGSAELRMNEH